MRTLRRLGACAIAAGLAGSPAAAAGGSAPDATEKPAERGVLDGRAYAGAFGPAGRDAGRDDTLYFRDGHFWSANCVPCGFRPAVYWTRRVGDAIHFRGEMHSVDRGRFVYAGVVRNGVLSATIAWRKDRWYWSIDRDFRFEGSRVDAAAIGAVADAAHRAALAGEEPDPSAVCPL